MNKIRIFLTVLTVFSVLSAVAFTGALYVHGSESASKGGTVFENAEQKEYRRASEENRIMTIEDYAGDGEAVFGSDLSGYRERNTEEEDEYDKVPGDTRQVMSVPGTDVSDWNLILVNKQNPVPEDYEYNLTWLNDSKQIDRRIIEPVERLFDAAKEDGIELMICSAYRSYERQTTLFNNKLDKLIGAGMCYLDAFRTASYSVTIPGTSEHQLGLALDIITPDYTALDSGFADTEAGKWLKENAAEYGFILRYPAGKEYITGIIFEPWHFRYVGVENAKYMTDNGLVLEEYIDLLLRNRK
ncbi:MAG TPA: D-Ala-D-Ala carboxypeptidase VanY [Lachnospiraceae bacterium]|nr:D-Ala-D-Ala carboxypeptidase VanY [Lachnospiraceae bacterium]